MSASAEYVAYIRDLLTGFSDLTSRKFFGGIAFRSSALGEDVQFAMVINDVLYFVVDDISRPEYQARGMQPFSYEKKTGVVTVRKYYAAPEELFEDERLMNQWAQRALQAAMRLKK